MAGKKSAASQAAEAKKEEPKITVKKDLGRITEVRANNRMSFTLKETWYAFERGATSTVGLDETPEDAIDRCVDLINDEIDREVKEVLRGKAK